MILLILIVFIFDVSDSGRHDSSVNSVTRLDNWSSIPGRVGLFSLHRNVQTVSGAHPDYPIGIGVLYSGVQQLMRQTNHLPPFSVEVS
jgi:hypothetical protein